MQAVKMDDGTVILTMSPDDACIVSSAMQSAARAGYSTSVVCERAQRMSERIYQTAAGDTFAQARLRATQTLEDATIWRNRAQEAEASLLTAQDDLEYVISGERPNGTEPAGREADAYDPETGTDGLP